ncbi:MAG: type VI secretion system baseplate subunit TssE [Planctomycetota bacterium]
MTKPLPTLADRLRRETGGFTIVGKPESTRRRVAREMQVLRDSIEQGIRDLLGTRRGDAIDDPKRWAEAEKSVLSYGVPDLSGLYESGLANRPLLRELKRIIRRFETRLHPHSVEVDILRRSGRQEALELSVSGTFGPLDAPHAFSLGLSICLVTGNADSLHPRQAA